jgi:hypothetical protein
MKKGQPKLSKAEIAQQMKARQEADRGKSIVRDVLYPILHEHATTISNAERMTEIFKTVIMLAMQRPFKDKTVGDLDFSEDINNEKDDKSRIIFQSFLDGFKGVPIGEAVKILQEFSGGVNAYFDNESRTREFTSLTLEDLIGK